MLNENSSRKSRLDAFDFDRDVSPAFVARLARENGWSRGYAERVCAEYKRFALLSRSAEHPCTPSDQVDQAWHLHVLHTASYWEHFCGEVLDRPLHHGPTRDRAVETEKLRAWYEKTLQSYRACFGEDPPRDIWPPPAERVVLGHVRVDQRRYWLVPKRMGVLPVRASLLVALLVALFFVGELFHRASLAPLFQTQDSDGGGGGCSADAEDGGDGGCGGCGGPKKNVNGDDFRETGCHRSVRPRN